MICKCKRCRPLGVESFSRMSLRDEPPTTLLTQHCHAYTGVSSDDHGDQDTQA